MGPMGGPMDFGRNKSKFQEVPETGITFDDVAVSFTLCKLLSMATDITTYVSLGSHGSCTSRVCGHTCLFAMSTRVFYDEQAVLQCCCSNAQAECKTLLQAQGVDGAKLELQEVVDFLKNPDKYTALGAKIPKVRLPRHNVGPTGSVSVVPLIAVSCALLPACGR